MSATRTPVRDRSRPTVVTSSQRFATATRSQRRRRWLRLLLLVLVVGTFAAAAWVLGWSDVLGVRTVEVVGAHRASDRLVDLTADVEPGTPLARVDTAAVAERLRTLRVVEDARVERVWPHTLRITVVERSAVAVARKGDTYRLVDRFGVDFAEVPRRRADLPFVDVDVSVTGSDQVRTALDVVDGLPARLGRQVQALEVHSPDDVRLRLRSGAVVLWGDASQGEQKAVVLQALLRQHADRYDVRAPLAPTTTG